MAFTHLHLHTEYSLLDGACRIKDVIKEAKRLNQTSIAITDHGVMYGAVEFYKAAKEEGIKPIIGCECYVAARSRHNKVYALDSERHHLVLLCKNETGYKNLIEMVSKSWTEGFYTKPRIDHELLEKHNEGLIALSACLAGEVPSALLRGDYEAAKETALRYNSVFGKGNYYIEVQNHGLRQELEILPDLYRLSEETGIPLVATNDVHYVRKEDAVVQQVLICIGTNHKLGEDTGLEFGKDEFYLKDEEEMKSLFAGHEEAVEASAEIAEKCNLDFQFGNTILPHFEVPNGQDHFEYFKNECYKGLYQKVGDNPPREYTDRLDYELGVVNKMGYVDYYLIVNDFVQYAKSHDIPVGPGRGSGAGSLCAYCIGITGIDPLKYNLLFERFLNPERVSMPDFDIDFCYVKRQKVIDYVISKYGADHVSQIVTFGTLAAKAAVRDVGRVMDVSYQKTDRIAKKIPNELHITIDRALEISKDLKSMYDTDTEVKNVIDMARRVEGFPRHASTHAAGVVITRDPVSSYVPLAVNEQCVVTQYTMTTLEQLGLLKMDFLGLRTLTVIDDTVRLLKKENANFSLGDIDISDKETYEMLSSGRTDAVFQFESAGMKSVLKRLKPRSLEDLIAVISLYRPGPADSIDDYIENRHHPEKTVYKCKQTEEILSVTYGCMVYQEQVMEICRKVAGYSYGRADLVRRAMAKKKSDVMEKERHNFIYGLKNDDGTVECAGAVANGISENDANELFDEMSNFAKYAFNKSHAAAYAFVSYQTAYLKCHYPKQFMAAILTSVLDNTTKVISYITECTRLGISVLPPSVNECSEGFSVNGDGIRFGLLAIKNIGRGFIKVITDERETGGWYTSFYDFCNRTFGKQFNRRAVESLIKCGALDGLGINRRQMLYMLPIVVAQIEDIKRDSIQGQIGFFDEGSVFAGENEPEVPNMEEMSDAELLQNEKEIIGLYLSGHPMKQYQPLAKSVGADNIGEILLSSQLGDGKYKDEMNVKVLCMITKAEKRTTKNGSDMVVFEVEDMTGTIECIAFSQVYSRRPTAFSAGNVALVLGRLSFREDKAPSLVCSEIETSLNTIAQKCEQTDKSKKRREGIFVRVENMRDERLKKLKILESIFDEYLFPVYVFDNENKKYILYSKGQCCDSFIEECRYIFGTDNVAVRKN